MSKDNIKNVRKRIKLASEIAGKEPDEVRLVCVTKGIDPYMINEAIIEGINEIGENKVQEALAKKPDVMPGVKWHLIGHLQTNKVKDAIKIFDLIHSLDNMKLARKIDKEAKLMNKIVDVLIQINTSGEEAKYGISPDEVPGFLEELSKLQNLQIQGLMTITPLSDNPETVKPYLIKLKEIFDKITAEHTYSNIQMKYLSMGMTQDFEAAIEVGANMVRIGTAIFGEKR